MIKADGAFLKDSIALKAIAETPLHIEYGPTKVWITASASDKIHSKDKSTGGSGVGQYIKSELIRLLEGGLLTPVMIENSKDKSYSSKNLGISFPVIVETTDPLGRYYKGEPVCGKYRICSQWVVRHRVKFDLWLAEMHAAANVPHVKTLE